MERFETWEESVSPEIRGDPLRDLRVYRMALYAGDTGAEDADTLGCDPRATYIADQLRRAAGSISSNIAEGYSRYAPRDRAKFLEYALGSARESRDWYHKARLILGARDAEARLVQLGHIVRILTTLIARSRNEKS